MRHYGRWGERSATKAAHGGGFGWGRKRQRLLHLEVGERPQVVDDRAREVSGAWRAVRQGRAVRGCGRRGGWRGRSVARPSVPGAGRAQALGRGSRWAETWASDGLPLARKMEGKMGK